ncbi:MAG: tetratricopeptide repeat protein [Bacteroidia bacterium]|nr:tetratricopeptide repeat protein [Bacteroidia bacterium]
MKNFMFPVILFITTSLLAENTNIDSLLQLYNNAPDTAKLRLLVTIAWKYRGINPDKSIYYYNEGIRLSDKLNNQKEKARFINGLGIIHEELGKYDKAMEFYNKALKIREQISDSSGIATSLGAIGNCFGYKGDFEKSKVYIQKSLDLSLRIQDKTLIAMNYTNMAAIFLEIGKIEKALDYFLKTLKIFEELNNLANTSVSLLNIAAIYNSMNNLEKTKEYLFKALNINRRLNDKKGLAACYNDIGTLYYQEKDYKNALDYCLQSVRLMEEMKDLYGLSESYNIISAVYRAENNVTKAIEYDFKAIKIREEIDDKIGMAETYYRLGISYRMLKEYNKSIEVLSKSLELAISIGLKPRIYKSYQQLSLTYYETGRYKEAFDLYEKYSLLKDSIYDENTQKQFTEMQTKYETEKKEKEIQLLNKDKQLKNVEFKKQTIVKNAFIAGFIFLLLLIFIVLFSYKKIRNKNKILKLQKAEIEEKNEELHQQNEEIASQRDVILQKNQVLQQQKEEIEAQRDEIETQHALVTKQKEKIEFIHGELTDSIRYAQRIQQAVLPGADFLNEIFSTGEYFILFKPRDIVSGDLYWCSQRNNYLLIAVADCTGHGVPGAFMSMLGIAFLNEIVAHENVVTASQVLDLMREYIIRSLQQKGISGEQKDGMDIVFCAIDKPNSRDIQRADMSAFRLQFAGANNSLYLIQTVAPQPFVLEEIKGDKMPVAIHTQMRPFTNHEIEVHRGDIIYISSDGYADQFGGPNGKKFKSKNFRELINSICSKPLPEQKDILDRTIEEWKAFINPHTEHPFEQIDDITVMGVKI